jgi:hypothetical protein
VIDCGKVDVEQKIQFIIDSQGEFWASLKAHEAASEAAHKSFREEHKAFQERHKRAEARMDRFDKSLQGMRTLMRVGMREMIDIRQSLKELAAAQKKTEATLNAFMRVRGNGDNGKRRT